VQNQKEIWKINTLSMMMPVDTGLADRKLMGFPATHSPATAPSS
jgi:hypothetical protein